MDDSLAAGYRQETNEPTTNPPSDWQAFQLGVFALTRWVASITSRQVAKVFLLGCRAFSCLTIGMIPVFITSDNMEGPLWFYAIHAIGWPLILHSLYRIVVREGHKMTQES